MVAAPSSALVTPSWLARRLETEDLIIVDATWRLPGSGKPDGTTAFQQVRVPGAVHFDLDKIADPRTALPHMAPPPDIFETAMGRLGIAQSDTVIVYDADGLFAAPRVWWTFRAMGHDRVKVLNGGLRSWTGAGFAIEAGAPRARPAADLRPYSAAPDPESDAVIHGSGTSNRSGWISAASASSVSTSRGPGRFVRWWPSRAYARFIRTALREL